jgi:hypothetical protein
MKRRYSWDWVGASSKGVLCSAGYEEWHGGDRYGWLNPTKASKSMRNAEPTISEEFRMHADVKHDDGR